MFIWIQRNGFLCRCLTQRPGQLNETFRPVHIQKLGNQGKESQSDTSGNACAEPSGLGDVSVKKNDKQCNTDRVADDPDANIEN